MSASSAATRTAALDARDRRTGGRWTLLQRLKNVGIYYAIAMAIRVADRLPARWLVGIGRLSGRVAWRCCRTTRYRTERAIARSLPSADASSLARRCFRTAGENLAVCLLLRREVDAADFVEIDEQARRTLASVADEGRGAVFISAHFGPFELVAAAIAELGHEPAVVVRESYDPRLDPIVDAHRERRGVAVIHRGRPGAATRIVRALRSGKLVGFLPDLGGRVTTLRAPWLGGSLPIAVGPQRIALRTGCPVLFGVVVPRASAGPHPRFRLRLVSLDGTDERALTQRVATELARAIHLSPEQWLWMGAEPSQIADVSA